ncbi:hypothetical protein HXK74_01640 [Candidatus Gracilibacteria bacterium]|nr:hypothetical protein [Candidatus Gracilibacteria bacterium]
MSFLCAKKRRFQIRPQAENAELASSNALGIPSSSSIRYRIHPVLKDSLQTTSTVYIASAIFVAHLSLPRRYFIIPQGKNIAHRAEMNKERDQTFFFFSLVSEKLLIKSRIFLRIKKSKIGLQTKIHLNHESQSQKSLPQPEYYSSVNFVPPTPPTRHNHSGKI